MLAEPLEARAVVIKEIEVRNEDIRLNLVAAGAELDVPGLLRTLENTPGLDDVQVRQNPDPVQAT